MVFYRKYRAQTLEELAGQENVKQAIRSAFSQQKLAHAYLLCGPKGTGKTSTARILAKMVNCENPIENFSPCNKCQSCVSITDGSSLDVIEMDAASNRGIEDIRSLRENIKLAPSSSKKKVYIIDEVHMLSGDAFNALLKTLEEPPVHVIFILATTEAQKIPQTILSRVQRLDFKPASTEELMEVLKKIAKKEGLKAEDEALMLLAKKAQGSFRDGVKFLDQISSLEKIDVATIEIHLGIGNLTGVIDLLEAIKKEDPSLALSKLTEQISTGVNPKELNLIILDTLRLLLFIKNGLGDQLVLPEIGAENYSQIKKLGEDFAVSLLLKTLDAFTKSLEQSRYVSIPSLPLEIAVVESSENQKSRIPEEQKMEKLGEKKVDVRENLEQMPSDVPTSRLGEREASLILRSSDAPNLSDLQVIQDRWNYVLETVRQNNYSLEALLRLVKISECGEKVIKIEVPYAFHQRILEAPKNRDLLAAVFSDILGRSVQISAVLGVKPVRAEDVANIEIAADDELVRLASEIFNSDSV